MATIMVLVRLLHNAVAADDQPQAGIAARCLNRGTKRGGVIAIAADIQAQIRLLPGFEQMANRAANHCGFLPRRDQDRDRPGQRAMA
jgi:hypothetical protein